MQPGIKQIDDGACEYINNSGGKNEAI